MSILSVFHAASPALAYKVLTHHDDIAATLAEQGVRFARWDSGARLRPGCSLAEVLDACAPAIAHLITEHGRSTVRLLSRDTADAAEAALRDEHQHTSDEVFALVSGRGQVSLRLGEHVYGVLCEKGDVLVIPAGTRRWFDLGDNPFCLALRLFADDAGAQPSFTGDASARQFVGMEEL